MATVTVDALSLTAAEALEKNRFVRHYGTTARQAVYCDYNQRPLGITQYAVASGDDVAVWPLSWSGTVKIEVACPVAEGDYLWPTADGKAISAGFGEPVLLAMEAGSAAGSHIEALPVRGFLENIHRLYEECYGPVAFSQTADGAAAGAAASSGQVWLKTSVDTNTDQADIVTGVDHAAGGVLGLLINDNALDSEEFQLNGEGFAPTSTKPLWMHWKIAQSDVDGQSLYFGLSIADTDIQGGVTDSLRFETDHDGNLDYVVEKNSTETKADTAVDLADSAGTDNFVSCDMYWSGAALRVFVDGAYIASPVTTNMPTDEQLSPFFGLHNSAAGLDYLYLDTIDIRQVR